MFEYLLELVKRLYTNLTLTIASLIVALILALVFTIILTLKTPVLVWLMQGYITPFTGTPLLVRIFLIYYGPGRFPALQECPALWHLLSGPRLCAPIALSLSSTAYTAQLFYGAIRAIPEGQWRSRSTLGMNRKGTLATLLPYAFKRSLSSYSNEMVLVFKSTSLACTITLIGVMGYSRLLYGRTYDVMVFSATGITYLVVNDLLTLTVRLIEREALVSERRNQCSCVHSSEGFIGLMRRVSVASGIGTVSTPDATWTPYPTYIVYKLL